MPFRDSLHSRTSAWSFPCLLLVVLSIMVAGSAWGQVSASISASTTFKPHTPLEVANGTATLVGHYNGPMLRLTLGLQPPHVAEEQQFLHDLQTPTKGTFHQFLSAAEWTERFDPSVEDEQAVVNWATAQGLTITRRFPNRLIVDVEGSVATIEKAFGVTMNSYQLGANTGFSNDRDPVIPSNLTGILHSIGGLQNLHTLRPMNKNAKEPVFPDYSSGPAVNQGTSQHTDGDRTKLPAALNPKANGVSPGYTSGPPYDPQDMYSSNAYDAYALYNLGHCCNPTGNSGGTPPDTSIAIATFGSQQGSDMNGFQSNYPYLAYHYFTTDIDGSPACCDGEGTMDMEWSTAMSNSFGAYQNTATIFMYDGVSPTFGESNDIYNAMLIDGYARNFSTSWGCEELTCYDAADMDTADSIFSSMVGEGWSLTAASGDQGSTPGCGSVGVQFPASDPNVVGAGGATLYLDPSFESVSAWSGGPDGCASNDGGSTGGYSAYFGEPPFQTGLPSRGVPDIALNADWYNTPQFYYFEGVLGGNGGTSIVAPQTVGFFAQENAYLLALGNICGSGSSPCAPLGAVNPYLYEEGYYGFAPHAPFYDITTGCNNNDITAAFDLTYYCTGPGWDAVTGWGMYNFLQLAWAINWLHVPGYSVPSVSFSGPPTNAWYNTDEEVTWTVTASPGNSAPSPGTSGFTQAWDYDPGNPTNAATPGQGNPFYAGPEYANSMAGCLDLTGSFCAGSVGGVQGWHTVNVRSWGNEGENGGDYTYGPIGYDTVAPVTTETLSGTKISGTSYKSAVMVTLAAADPGYPTTGSGVATTYYQLNTEGWHVYGGPFTVGFTGTYKLAYYSEDKAGNFETAHSSSFTIKPVLSVAPAALAFGDEVLGTTSASKTATLTNIGSSSVSISSISAGGDFAIASNTCGGSIAASAHCTITVTYKPSVVGAVKGDVTVVYGAIGSPDRVGLTGTGRIPIAASPTSVAFGAVAVGSTTAAKTITLENNNPSAAVNIGFSANGDYTAVAGGGTPCGASLAAGASCTINVTFKPEQNGAITGAITVTDGVALSPLIVALSGSGTGGVPSPLTLTPASLSFSDTVVQATATKTVTVKNTSASSLTVTGISASGDYGSSGCVATLASGASCTLTVTFTPSTTGVIKGAIAIKDGTSVSPQVLNATGTGELPLTITPATVAFGDLAVGTSSGSATVTLKNNQAVSTSITYTASGDFTATAGTCGATLGAGASCTILVSFSPTTTGAVSGAVNVAYTGGYSPQEVKLTGTGQ